MPVIHSNIPYNRPVGYHEVDYLLSCNHINVERIEAAIFIPAIGEKMKCIICNTIQIIEKMGVPYWIDQDSE